MANHQEDNFVPDPIISDDHVKQLAEVCKKRLMAMSVADHIKERGGK